MHSIMYANVFDSVFIVFYAAGQKGQYNVQRESLLAYRTSIKKLRNKRVNERMNEWISRLIHSCFRSFVLLIR